MQAIHPNVTFADLPKELQDQIAESTRAAFTQLLKEGYAVGPRQQMQQSRPIDRVPERQRRGPTGAARRADHRRAVGRRTATAADRPAAGRGGPAAPAQAEGQAAARLNLRA